MRVVLLLLLVAPAVALAQAGRFLLSAGEVTLVRGAQEIRAAAGTAVEPGDTIRVGARSNAQIRMSDQSIISLRSNTEFRIDEYVFSGRGDDGDRSVFSLLKGGMRTVGGALARRQSDAFLQTSARPELPSGPQPAAEEKKPRAESDSKVFDLIKAPLRTVAGALTPTRHAVRVPTATIGVRGTHYTLVHCNNDCFEPRRTSVASALLAQSDAGAPGVNLAPNGTYGGISDGLIGVVNNRDDQEFGANSFFYVASIDSLVQSLIGPPGFLYDRLEAQGRNLGQTAKESTATMANSGLNAESRPSDTPVPPAPPTFIVTEQRSDSGAIVVVPGAPGNPIPPLMAPNTAFLSAFTNATRGPDTVGAFVDASAANLVDTGDGFVRLEAFNVPSGSTANLATGSYSGSAAGIQDKSLPNALNAHWGIWFDGSATDATGTTTFLSSGNFFHYLVGPNTPPEVVAAKSGTATMVMVGGTAPTNNLGLSGSFTAGTTLTVDFTGRTVAFPTTTILILSDTWTFSPSASPITIQPGRGAFISNTASGSCSGTGCGVGAATLARTGIFMGPAADHLGVALHGRATSGATVQGTQLFSCAPNC